MNPDRNGLFSLRQRSRSRTCALKAVSRRGEQQLALHALRPGAAGDPGLLVPALHPVREPAQAAVAVQRVRSDRPEETHTQVRKPEAMRSNEHHQYLSDSKFMDSCLFEMKIQH